MKEPGDLTERQRKLHRSVIMAASSTDEQMLMVRVMATRLGCSQADVDTVRDVLLKGHLREKHS